MSNRLLVATRKGLFILGRNHDGWGIRQASFLGDNVPMVLPDTRDDTIYAALDHGHFGTKVHRSRDAGQTWEEIGVPTYPPKPEGLDEPPATFDGRPNPWKLIRIWSLEAGHPSQPGVLWCGTIPGGLFRSENNGAAWELVQPLWGHPLRTKWMGGGADYPGIHSICVHPTDPGHMAIGVSTGGIWLTADGGQTWNVHASGMRAEYMPPELQFEPVAQDDHRLVQCRSAPDCYWVQHHNGIFKSTDGARSWQEIKDVPPSVFGFAVAVHPHDPNTAWFVPGIKDERRIPVNGQVVVTRTRDGGKSFDVLRRGLPQEHAYDLVFRHSLDVDETGDQLAFGSTTGSLWVSEDQGDSWQCLSTHLPPIYCVRFVK